MTADLTLTGTLPLRESIDVMHTRCAVCGAVGDLLLPDQPILEAIEEGHAHVRRRHATRSAVYVLDVVATMAYLPHGTTDAAAWLAGYNERTRSSRGMTA
ncbi:hypothetical protein ACIP6P_32560 [Streptomyces sp. NPDC088729]|uniref:hypothetical protein n=1 Tax=Streptomyces sp. NPDC088729 TaxID=3365876 RepID=UPI0037FA0AE2